MPPVDKPLMKLDWNAAPAPLLNDCRPCWRLSVLVQFMLVTQRGSKRDEDASRVAWLTAGLRAITRTLSD